jgi:cytochrome c556
MSQQCSEMVSRGAWSRQSPCTRPGTIERDGKLYCKQHDPVAKAEKRAARDKVWEAEWARERAHHDRIAAMSKFFENVPTVEITGHFSEYKRKGSDCSA